MPPRSSTRRSCRCFWTLHGRGNSTSARRRTWTSCSPTISTACIWMATRATEPTASLLQSFIVSRSLAGWAIRSSHTLGVPSVGTAGLHRDAPGRPSRWLYGRLRSGDGSQGGSSDGSLPFGCAEQLRAAVGAPPCQGILVGAAGQWDYKNVVPAAGPGGGGPANQNGGLQCVDLAGQSLDGKLGRRLIRLTEALPPYQPALGLQLQGLQQHVPVLVESLWDPGHAVPDSSQWTIDRPQPPVPVFARRAKKGAVEGPQIGGSFTKRAPGWQALEKSFRGSSRPTPSSASEALGSTCRS